MISHTSKLGLPSHYYKLSKINFGKWHEAHAHNSVRNWIFRGKHTIDMQSADSLLKKWAHCLSDSNAVKRLSACVRTDVLMMPAVVETVVRIFKAWLREREKSAIRQTAMCMCKRTSECIYVCRSWHIPNGECFLRQLNTCENSLHFWLLSFKYAFILVYVSTMNSFGDIFLWI